LLKILVLSVKKAPGEGMPIRNENINAKNFNKPLEKDLYIKFDIVFPKTLTEEQKQEIKRKLPS